MATTDFDGTEVLLVDGNNYLHRTHGSADRAAQDALANRLRQVVPPTLRAVVVFDGPSDRGNRPANVESRQAGSTTADEALLEIIRSQPELARAGTILVTDDRPLTERARRLGARTRRLDWLVEILDRPQLSQPGTTIGASAKGPRGALPTTADDEREPWTPGRGATRKRGNPKRRPR